MYSSSNEIRSYKINDDTTILFDGSKSFFGSRSNLVILIAEHHSAKTIELVVFDSLANSSAPRIYMNAKKLKAKFEQKQMETVDLKVEEMEKYLIYPNKEELAEQVMTQMITDSVISQLSTLSAMPLGTINDSFNPKFGHTVVDTVCEFYSKNLDVVCEKPYNVKPIEINHHKSGNIYDFHYALKQFKNETRRKNPQKGGADSDLHDKKLEENILDTIARFKAVLKEKISSDRPTHRGSADVTILPGTSYYSAQRALWIRSIKRVILQQRVARVRERVDELERSGSLQSMIGRRAINHERRKSALSKAGAASRAGRGETAIVGGGGAEEEEKGGGGVSNQVPSWGIAVATTAADHHHLPAGSASASSSGDSADDDDLINPRAHRNRHHHNSNNDNNSHGSGGAGAGRGDRDQLPELLRTPQHGKPHHSNRATSRREVGDHGQPTPLPGMSSILMSPSIEEKLCERKDFLSKKPRGLFWNGATESAEIEDIQLDGKVPVANGGGVRSKPPVGGGEGRPRLHKERTADRMWSKHESVFDDGDNATERHVIVKSAAAASGTAGASAKGGRVGGGGGVYTEEEYSCGLRLEKVNFDDCCGDLSGGRASKSRSDRKAHNGKKAAPSSSSGFHPTRFSLSDFDDTLANNGSTLANYIVFQSLNDANGGKSSSGSSAHHRHPAIKNKLYEKIDRAHSNMGVLNGTEIIQHLKMAMDNSTTHAAAKMQLKLKNQQAARKAAAEANFLQHHHPPESMSSALFDTPAGGGAGAEGAVSKNGWRKAGTFHKKQDGFSASSSSAIYSSDDSRTGGGGGGGGHVNNSKGSSSSGSADEHNQSDSSPATAGKSNGSDRRQTFDGPISSAVSEQKHGFGLNTARTTTSTATSAATGGAGGYKKQVSSSLKFSTTKTASGALPSYMQSTSTRLSTQANSAIASSVAGGSANAVGGFVPGTRNAVEQKIAQIAASSNKKPSSSSSSPSVRQSAATSMPAVREVKQVLSGEGRTTATTETPDNTDRWASKNNDPTKLAHIDTSSSSLLPRGTAGARSNGGAQKGLPAPTPKSMRGRHRQDRLTIDNADLLKRPQSQYSMRNTNHNNNDAIDYSTGANFYSQGLNGSQSGSALDSLSNNNNNNNENNNSFNTQQRRATAGQKLSSINIKPASGQQGHHTHRHGSCSNAIAPSPARGTHQADSSAAGYHLQPIHSTHRNNSIGNAHAQGQGHGQGQGQDDPNISNREVRLVSNIFLN